MPASGIKSPENERISLQSVCGSDFLRKDVGEVAKEAIEAVKAAEEKAAQIISDTQKRAAKLLEDVARSERDELNALSQKCEKEKDFAKKELEGELFANEEKFRAELSQKCEMLRKKDDGTRENIIGRIIEAVKS